ncbi:hypothetical protein JXA85_03000 [Candidatus Woesearchaeota archaeon]|nr:hypothetical protein [Candidatus Woesearchaeota archaeon]
MAEDDIYGSKKKYCDFIRKFTPNNGLSLYFFRISGKIYIPVFSKYIEKEVEVLKCRWTYSVWEEKGILKEV